MKRTDCARFVLFALVVGLVSPVVAAPPRGQWSPYSSPNSVYLTAAQSSPSPAAPPMSSPATPAEDVLTPVPDMGHDGPINPHSFEPDWGYDGFCGEDFCTTDCCPTGMWYGSADYLLIRARLSQGVAVNRSQSDVEQFNDLPAFVTTADSFQFPFDYESAFRVTLGYRLLDCGGDISVSYWRITSDASIFMGPSGEETGPFFAGTPENVTGNFGDRFFSAFSDIKANVWDIDFAKCLSFGGPTNPCDCFGCPRWDLRWSAGVRIADIARRNHNFITDDEGDFISGGFVDTRFVGAGPRVSLQGRRYFGACGRAAAFAKASQALLIGDYRFKGVQIGGPEPESITPIEIDNKVFSRMIPVTDIEIGASLQVAPCATVSVGWLFQCWWDLGQGETIGATNALDTANILGFDGLFVRGELLF